MTVIATDGRTMAGDGLCLSGWTVISKNEVKVESARGSILGYCGTRADCRAFAHFFFDNAYQSLLSLHKKQSRPNLGSGFAALALSPTGQIILYDDQCFASIMTEPFAIGVGADLAIGAMKAGASPRRAVEIACEVSSGCGGRITVVRSVEVEAYMAEHEISDEEFESNHHQTLFKIWVAGR